MQIVIALVVTPDGLPVACETMQGNTSDGKTIALPRYTQPDKDLQILLHRRNLTLPANPHSESESPPKKQLSPSQPRSSPS